MLRSLKSSYFPRKFQQLFFSRVSNDKFSQLREDVQLEFFLVQFLKQSVTLLRSGKQAHALAVKSGLDVFNVFVRNAIINLYAKSGLADAADDLFNCGSVRDTATYNIVLALKVKQGRLEDARGLFDEIPDRDSVSFTTMIMGLAQNHRPGDAIVLFRDMMTAGVAPTEVTFASVISACSRLFDVLLGSVVHGLAVKYRIDNHVLVSTNLIHLYAVCLRLKDAEAAFSAMPEKNTITWNAMLNGYAKAGLIDSAKNLFERIPERDLVSWSTMIDGYVRVDCLAEAFLTFIEMLRRMDARVNEVMLVDLVLACGRFSAIHEGQQLHSMIVKTGLDSHSFVQATLVHLYSTCHHIDLALSQFQAANKENVSCWNALIAGFLKNNMVKEARKLFNEMPARDVVSWTTLIRGYVQNDQHNAALDLFQEMLRNRFQPNDVTLVSLLSAIANSGTTEQGLWISKYIYENSVPLTDNLSAGLIDMYSKHGKLNNALRFFNQRKHNFTTASPWNAIICGLAMHGNSEMALQTFEDLEKTSITPNAITFLGALTACCHAGMVNMGKQYFDKMQSAFKIAPTIKHYGCMVDLLGRAGCFDEAEQLIETMPMEADVTIWGSVLAASRIHGMVEVGERAAEELAKLQPGHGAGRVLLSNIYADAGRWNDVNVVRRNMETMRVEKSSGCSEILQ